jgi:chromosome segregation ATPase
LAAAVEQLATLGVTPGDQESVAKTIAALRKELTDEKLVWEEHKRDAKTLSQLVEELKKTTDQLSTYVSPLESKVKTRNGTITDLHTELHARELSLEQTTATNDDFQCQSTQLIKNLESMCSSHYRLSLSSASH